MHAALKLINHRFQQPDPGATGTPGVAAPPVSMVSQQPGTTPLVLDSPHSGTFYPHDFGAVCDLPTLRRAEDTHVEKIYAFAPALGVAWVEAHFPRIYLDANRDTTELDTTLLDGEWTDPISTDPKVLSKVRLGKGLIWKFTDEGEPIYNRLLSVAEVRARIDRCWRPYHGAVAQAIDAAHARHGYSIHINCHSMPAVAASHATEFPGMVHADFVVGDRDGSTASPAQARAAAGISSSAEAPRFSQSHGKKHPMISHSAVAKKSSVVLSVKPVKNGMPANISSPRPL